MEYALAAMRRPEQTIYTLVDRGFAAMEYLGPSELYPWMRRVTRLKATMILDWDSVSAPLHAWPLYEGEVVEIPVARLGEKKAGALWGGLGPRGSHLLSSLSSKRCRKSVELLSKTRLARGAKS